MQILGTKFVRACYPLGACCLYSQSTLETVENEQGQSRVEADQCTVFTVVTVPQGKGLMADVRRRMLKYYTQSLQCDQKHPLLF